MRARGHPRLVRQQVEERGSPAQPLQKLIFRRGCSLAFPLRLGAMRMPMSAACARGLRSRKSPKATACATWKALPGSRLASAIRAVTPASALSMLSRL